MRQIITIENAKGYATEANLMKKVNQIFPRYETNDRCIICRKPDGKWTALFELDKRAGGFIGHYAQHGFYSF